MSQNNENGYTLVEVFVVMSLIGLIISFSYIVYGFGMRSYENWKSSNQLYREAVLVRKQFQDDIYGATRVITCTEDKLEIQTSGGSLITYHIDKQQLMREGVTITTEEIKLTDTQFNILGLKRSLFTADSSCNDIRGVGLYTEVNMEEDSLIIDMSLMLRQATTWN